MTQSSSLKNPTHSAGEAVIKHRTYDPNTKTLKKHVTDEDIEMDTVEKKVDGLAEQIVAEDAERRMQELVCFRLFTSLPSAPAHLFL
jgi:coiled-coil domain-containing protein 12